MEKTLQENGENLVLGTFSTESFHGDGDVGGRKDWDEDGVVRAKI